MCGKLVKPVLLLQNRGFQVGNAAVIILVRLGLSFQSFQLRARRFEILAHGVKLVYDLRMHRLMRAGFVHKVDSLIRKKAIGYITLRKRDYPADEPVGYFYTVVLFVIFFYAGKDFYRVVHGGFVHRYGLEPAFERGILFDILAVFRKRRRTDKLYFPAGKSRL